MDGYTFLSIMKSTPDYATIPVIVTTQNDGETDEVAAALAHGATDFVAKLHKPQVIPEAPRGQHHQSAGRRRPWSTSSSTIGLTGLTARSFSTGRPQELLAQNPLKRRYDVIYRHREFQVDQRRVRFRPGTRLLCGMFALHLDGERVALLRPPVRGPVLVCAHGRQQHEPRCSGMCERSRSALCQTPGAVSMKWGVRGCGSDHSFE